MEQTSNQQFSNFPRIMRALGAVALVASGVAFLFEGWHSLTNFGKFGAFTAFLMALGAAGAFCSYVLREQKGARCFLGLAAAGVTVQAAQLGALTYALASPSSADLRSLMLYEATGAATLGLMVAIFLVLLMPVAGLGFAALARTQARFAAGLFLGLNALLLVPTRVDLHAFALGAAAVLVLLRAEREVFRGDASMATTEGWILRAILAGPVLTLFGRELYYPVSQLAAGLLAHGAGAGLFVLAGTLLSLRKAFALPAQVVCMVLVGLGWLLLGQALHLSPLLTWLPVSWSAIALSFYSAGTGQNYRSLGAVGALAACVVGLHHEAAWLTGVNLTLNGLLLAGVASQVRELSVLRSGVISFLAGVAYVLWSAAAAVEWNSWVGLAAIGAVALLGSSYLERNRERLVGAYSAFRGRTREWN